MEKTSFTKTDIELIKKACLLCDKSPCDVKSGCLLAKDGQILTEGCNFLLSGDCSDHKQCAFHAEAAAVGDAAMRGVALGGSTAYVSRFPCEACTRLLVKSGVKKVYYMSNHFSGGNEGLPVFEANSVEVVQIPEEVVWGRD